jgi:hypothetical protein
MKNHFLNLNNYIIEKNAKIIEIQEAKQRGLLYHFTDFKHLESIIKEGVLKSNYEKQSNLNVISLTRDKNFWKEATYLYTVLEACLVLDGNKISNNYKISPFQYDPFYGMDNMDFDGIEDGELNNWRNTYDEKEERIVFKKKNGKIPIKKYLTEMWLINRIYKRNMTEIVEKFEALLKKSGLDVPIKVKQV